MESTDRDRPLFVGPPAPAPTPPASVDARGATMLAEAQALASALVEQASFGGDGQRGVARLRFGAGARGGLAGATVTLCAEGDRMSLTLEDGDDAAREALAGQLRASGIEVEEA